MGSTSALPLRLAGCLICASCAMPLCAADGPAAVVSAARVDGFPGSRLETTPAIAAPFVNAALIEDAAGASRGNFLELARVLDAAAEGSGELGDVARLLLLASSRDAVRDALRSLLPALARQRAVKQRHAYRWPGRNPPPARGAPILLASVDPGVDAAALAAEQSHRPRSGVWLQAWTDRGKQDDRAEINGFESSTRGISLGLDRDFSARWSAGVSVTRQTGTIDSRRYGQDDLEVRELATYGSLAMGSNVLSATLSYADNESDRERVVIVNTDAGSRSVTLTADIDSSLVAGSLSWMAAYGESTPFTVSPFAALGFTQLKTDDYLESGGGNLALAVETATERALTGSAGVSFGASRAAGNWLTGSSLTIAFERDFDADPTRTLSTFAGTRFTFESRGFNTEQSRWRFALGLQLLHVEGFGLSLALETQRGNDYHYDAAIIGAQTRF